MNQQQIDSLLRAAVYPEETNSVSHLQTHISHLFLTDRHVYKIKKPVDFGFLDFSSLEKRHFYCEEELRLNRRLSPDIYLGVMPLYADGAGGYCFSGNGEAKEYAVMMRRMPEDRMMSRLLETGRVTTDDVEQIARVVAGFHAAATAHASETSFGSVESIRSNWIENLRQTEQYIGRTISPESHQLIERWALMLLDTDRQLFEERVDNGFIRECDGDLHSENICLDGQVHIFDCIEFNEKFRYSDTAADVAFLAMDLENHGCRELAEDFVSAYLAASGDATLPGVLPLYLANRAFIRGKVESFRLDDPLISAPDQAAASERAKRFFRLAQGYVVRPHLPHTLIITCGLTGSGKSTLARELCFQLGIRHLSSDHQRKLLAGVAQTERGAAIYTREWNRATYEKLSALADGELVAGRSVLVDATFRRHADRVPFISLAENYGVKLIILDLVCSADLARQRLATRQEDNSDSSDGTWGVYQQQRKGFEAPTDAEGWLIQLDAALPLEEMVMNVFRNVVCPDLDKI